jgi:hypothetical protein
MMSSWVILGFLIAEFLIGVFTGVYGCLAGWFGC